MSLRETKKQQTALQIQAAARRLFLRQGYEATSVEQIAEAAGISRAGLFNYYRGKAAVLEALSSGLESRLVQLVEHYGAKSLTTAEYLEQLFAYAARVLEQTGGLTRLLFIRGSGGAGFAALEQAFAARLQRGQDRGELRADLGAQELAEFVYLGFVAGLLGWCRRPGASAEGALIERARSLSALLAPAAGDPRSG